ncbi:hypothetical protein [Sphingomonas koreensis]|uniref:hypothetical protein n=1 Tax=Sphingomonas koreensis TaxID=93064 RepID=UPI00234F552B|nr:hypothetical protein [Sphingomonas koreensis]MDC7810782.1 hypothetical protein [Sphingomonas koreensis]
MTKAISFLVPVVLMAGMATACGQNRGTTEAGTEDAAAPTVAENTGRTAPAAVAETAVANFVAPTVTTIATLPLKRGFYVASDTACGQSSNATTLLVSREGINGSRDRCTFKKIEKVGATTFRVTSECSDGGAAWGREDTVETYTHTYEIPTETSFKVTYEDGSEKSSRYCAQSSMSLDFRDNDISDVTR